MARDLRPPDRGPAGPAARPSILRHEKRPATARDANADPERRRARTTVAVYLGVLGIALLVVLWSSRHILFQPWTARAWTTGATAGGRVYLVGGRGSTGVLFADTYTVDPVARRLRRGGALPGPLFGAGAAVAGDRVIVAGGFDGRTALSQIVSLDIPGGRVTVLGTLPHPLAFAGAAAMEGVVYLAGGWDGTQPVDEILAVDPATGRVHPVGHLPTSREQVAMTALGRRLYVAGGVDGAGQYLDVVLEMELDASDQTTLRRSVSLPRPRSRAALVAVATGVIVVGGWHGGELDDAYRVDTRGRELSVRTLPPLPRGASGAVAVAAGDRVYLLGGRDERFARQIGILSWDPESGESSPVILRGLLGL